MRNSALQEITLPDMSGGINTHDPEYDIADNQSPDMLNLWYKDMALCKRPGQTWLARRSGVYRVSEPYNGARAMHAGSKLYRWNADGMVRNAGDFDPSAGFPADARFGDYRTASAAGTVRGVPYEPGDTAIYVYNGTQEITLHVAGKVTTAGNASITVTGAGIAGSPVVLNAALEEGDSAAEAAGKLRTALAALAAVTALYTVGGQNRTVTLTQAAPGTADDTLGLAVDNGTCEGLAPAASYDASVWRNAIMEIQSGIADSPGAFCEFGDGLYYIDGGEIWEIAPDYTVEPVEPYTPLVMINALPDLSGSDDNEAYNLIGPGFTVWYNGTGDTTINYYVAANPTTSTFRISALASGTVVNITSAGTPGWRVRKAGGNWITGTPSADEASNTITLAAHGLAAGDAVQFDTGTGVLPKGISAYDDKNTTLYQLPQMGLDDTEVLVSVDAVDLKEGVDFTVDREGGKVDFAGGTSPHGMPNKGTSNVWITAYKTVAESKRKITGCTSAVRFGGEAAGVTGGTRVFVTGNPDYPYHYWRSDLGLHVSAGMAYFPDTSEEVLDQNSEAITAAAKMGDELILFKENSIFAVGYSFDGKDVYYPVRECHSAIGCDMPGSVQLIDNRLVFANSKSGVYMLASSSNELENIVKPLSANINRLLLKEDGLKAACSCDFDRYYWLCVNGHAYLWDYDTTPYYNYADYDKAQKRLAWYRFDNIKAGEFFEDGGLCYGGPEGVVSFTQQKNDFGQAVSAYFISKAFNLGSPEDEKTFMYLYPSFSMDGNIKVTVSAGNERTDNYAEKLFDIRSFDWSEFSWQAFTWNRIKFAKTYGMRLNMRRAAFLQVKVSGGDIDRGVGLSGLRATYYVNRKMKR